MRKLPLALLAAAAAFAISPAAMAATININFSCSSGSGNTTSSAAICSGSNPASSSPVGMAFWNQSGFTVSTTALVPGADHGGGAGAWDFNPNQGNPLPGLTALSSGTIPNTSPPVTGEEVVITDAGEPFYLESIDIKGSSSVTITGRLANGNGVFQFTASNSASFKTILDSLYSHDVIDMLQIDFTGGGINYLDNIDLDTPTPEPGSLLLLATGLLGLGALIRRKIAA